jgi:hypothetical protein
MLRVISNDKRQKIDDQVCAMIGGSPEGAAVVIAGDSSTRCAISVSTLRRDGDWEAFRR